MITKAGIFKYFSLSITITSIVLFLATLTDYFLLTITMSIVAIALGVISLKEEKNLVAIISLLLIALFWGYFLSIYLLGWLMFGGS